MAGKDCARSPQGKAPPNIRQHSFPHHIWAVVTVLPARKNPDALALQTRWDPRKSEHAAAGVSGGVVVPCLTRRCDLQPYPGAGELVTH